MVESPTNMKLRLRSAWHAYGALGGRSAQRIRSATTTTFDALPAELTGHMHSSTQRRLAQTDFVQ